MSNGNVRKFIEDDLKHAIKLGMQKGILINPNISNRFYEDMNIITSKYTRITDECEYIQSHKNAYENRQYLIALGDGGFFQIYFEFDIKSKNKSTLAKSNLCYMPPVVEDTDAIKNAYIRADFDKDSGSFFHSSAHIHIGFDTGIRLPIEDAMCFSEFLKMILYLFYKKEYKAMYSNCKGITYSRGNSVSRVAKGVVLCKEIEELMFLKYVK